LRDEEIIDLYWQREERAISETDIKYGRYCYAIAKNILKTTEDSEECVNDTWMHAWNAMPPERPNFLKLFLAGITRNLSLDTYKRNHAKKRGGDEMALLLDELEECIPSSRSIDEEMEAKELGKIINGFLNTLPERERYVFVRRCYFVESNQAIADKYNLSEQNVRVILNRTRKKLRAYLTREGYAV